MSIRKYVAFALVLFMLFSFPITTVSGTTEKIGENDPQKPAKTTVLDTSTETTEESDAKKVEIRVTVEGIPSGTEVSITLKKVANGDEPGLTMNETSLNHLAIFYVSVGGSCVITGGEVPGYVASNDAVVDLTHVKGNFVVERTITYTADSSIAVTGLTVSSSNLFLILGQSATIVANTIPGNASNQQIVWTSSDPSVATVNGGVVLAVGSGVATVSAQIEDNGMTYSASCEVTVAEVIEVCALGSIDAAVGEVITLPDQVEVLLDRGGTMSFDVTWVGAYVVDGVQRISFDAEGTYTLYGDVEFTSLQASVNIIVEGSGSTVMAESATLDKYSMGLFVGGTDTITAFVAEGVNTESLIWVSDDPSIASVSPGVGLTTTVTGNAIGSTNIQLKNYLGDVLATCLVSVAVDPIPAADEVLILATSFDSPEKVDEFATREDVWIRGFNLPNGEYYIKVTDKGSKMPLGVGDIQIDALTDDQFVFNLYAETHFNLTDKYSHEYFVYMSRDPDFPAGDDENGIPRTLMTNFRVGSPVPTASLVVDVFEMIDGVFVDDNFSDAIVGIDVLLVREIDGVEPIDANVSYYLNPLYGSTDESIPIELRTSKYTDEVKMVGHISADGYVVWDEPKEKLKIGGYYLLIDLPEGYISNLDLYNPYTDDGTLLKEIHLSRNDVVERDIYIFKMY